LEGDTKVIELNAEFPNPEEAEQVRQSMLSAGISEEDTKIVFDMFMGIKHEMIDTLDKGLKKSPTHLRILIQSMIFDAIREMLSRPEMKVSLTMGMVAGIMVASKAIPVPPEVG
jgi:hypothetical protein